MLARTALATLILLPIALARGGLPEVMRSWRPVVAFAVVEIMAPWLLLGVAEQHLSSSLTGLLIAGVPLVGAVLAVVTRSDDRLDRRRVAGLLLGFAGVAALVGFEVGGGEVGAVVAVAVVVVCYAVVPPDPLALAVAPARPGRHHDVAGAHRTGLSAGWRSPRRRPRGRRPGRALGLRPRRRLYPPWRSSAFFALIAEIGPTRSTVITYVNPAVAVLLGVTLLDEDFTAATAIGFVLILAGSVLATRRAAVPTPAATGETEDSEVCLVPEP